MKLSMFVAFCLLVIIGHTSVTQAMDNQQKETSSVERLANFLTSPEGVTFIYAVPPAISLLYTAVNSSEAIRNDPRMTTAFSGLIASSVYTNSCLSQACKDIVANPFDHKKHVTNFVTILAGTTLVLGNIAALKEYGTQYYQNNTN
jgi:hypothetical protein